MRETQGLLSRTYHLLTELAYHRKVNRTTGYGSGETGVVTVGVMTKGPLGVCSTKHWWGALQAGTVTLPPKGAFVVSFLLLGPVPLFEEGILVDPYPLLGMR